MDENTWMVVPLRIHMNNLGDELSQIFKRPRNEMGRSSSRGEYNEGGDASMFS